MKKLPLMCLILTLFTGLVLADAKPAINLTGTWEGPTYADGPGIELTMTLVLKHEMVENTKFPFFFQEK